MRRRSRDNLRRMPVESGTLSLMTQPSSIATPSTQRTKESRFIETAFQNQLNAKLFERLCESGLPDWVLVSGCLFQTVWNVVSGKPVEHGIKDYDVFYFDSEDTGFEAEDRWIKKIAALTSDLACDVEVRNQSRVHLWYPEKFGTPYPELKSAFEGIDRFLHTSCAVGLYPDSHGHPKVYAPYGLDDLFDMVLRPNPDTPLDARRREKEARWCAVWPKLQVLK